MHWYRRYALRNIFDLVATTFFCLFLALGGTAVAQIDQGAITGTVTDAAGAAVPNAAVTLVNQDTNLTFTRNTGDTGFYSFTPIKIGNYSVTVKAASFKSAVRQNIRVDVSQTIGLNIVLQPGEVSETINVTSSTPALQTEDASTGQVFNTRVINDMPLDSRNYVFIAQLTTGVAAPNQGFRQVAGAGDFSSNGSRVSQNNFVLDGVDNNSNMQDFLNGATYAVRPPPDALEEFKVQSSGYSAELGRGTGAVVNASIKSGTNQIHGSLWEYLRNDRLAALDYFTPKRTAYHQNQFGGTLGGPIWKDRLFFFADAQGSRISSFVPAIANRTVPTDAVRNGDFTQFLNPNNTQGNGSIGLYLPGGNPTASAGVAEDPNGPKRYLMCNGVRNVICANQINPIAQRILRLFPEPNQGGPNQVFQNYTVPATSTTNNTTQYDARLDFNLSSKDQMFGRYSYSNNPTSFASPFGPILDGGGFGADGQNSNYGKSGVLSETHFFSPTFSNEFRLGFNWLYASYLQPSSQSNLASQFGLGGIPSGPNLGGFPQIGFGSGTNGIGVDNYLPSSERQNVLQIIDNISKVWGRHTVKAGINFQHVRFYLLQPPSGIGTQNFSGQYTSDAGLPNSASGSGYADFLLDLMNSSSINSITPITNLRWYYSSFLQDDWKLSSRLTLNLGLRWEYTQPLRVLNDAQANFVGNYANFNQGTGTYLIPSSQRNFPISAKFLSTLAQDHINVSYVDNPYLVNPRRVNFAPRVGFAYMADSKTVVRGGGGLFYGGLENIGGGLNLGNNAPFFVNANFNPTPNLCQNIQGAITCPTNGQTLETGFSSFLASPSSVANSIGTIYANDQNMKSAYTIAYNLTVQRALSDSLSFSLGYQANQSRHLRQSYLANSYQGVIPRGQNAQNYQPFHDFNIVNVASSGIAHYDSLQTKLEKRYTNGLYFLAGYTWAHCLDDAIGPIGQSQVGGYRNPTYLGFGYDYGSCSQDVRHRFTLAPQYELPFGAGKAFLNHGGILNQIVGGWKTSAIFQAQTGNPIFLNCTNQGGCYPIRIGDPFAPGGTPNPITQPNFHCATETRTLQQWFNPCAFINPPRAIINGGKDDPANNAVDISHAGNLPYGPRGRQGIYGPGFNKLDFSLFKSFAIPFHESSLQFRADAFNVLNHPSFSNPGSNLQGTHSQSLNSTRFSALIPDARVIQLSLRLNY